MSYPPPPDYIIERAARHLDDMTLPAEVRTCLGWLLDKAPNRPKSSSGLLPRNLAEYTILGGFIEPYNALSPPPLSPPALRSRTNAFEGSILASLSEDDSPRSILDDAPAPGAHSVYK